MLAVKAFLLPRAQWGNEVWGAKAGRYSKRNSVIAQAFRMSLGCPPSTALAGIMLHTGFTSVSDQAQLAVFRGYTKWKSAKTVIALLISPGAPDGSRLGTWTSTATMVVRDLVELMELPVDADLRGIPLERIKSTQLRQRLAEEANPTRSVPVAHAQWLMRNNLDRSVSQLKKLSWAQLPARGIQALYQARLGRLWTVPTAIRNDQNAHHLPIAFRHDRCLFCGIRGEVDSVAHMLLTCSAFRVERFKYLAAPLTALLVDARFLSIPSRDFHQRRESVVVALLGGTTTDTGVTLARWSMEIPQSVDVDGQLLPSRTVARTFALEEVARYLGTVTEIRERWYNSGPDGFLRQPIHQWRGIRDFPDWPELVDPADEAAATRWVDPFGWPQQ